jgi:IclR family pca regulon transcriptional regulator
MSAALVSEANKDRRRAAPGRKDSYVQSLAKGLDVLEAFGLHEPALSIARVAALTKLDRAGARRLLLTLEHLGYVASDGKRFHLTARILSLGYRYVAGLPFWRAAQPVMEELATALEETVSIGVLDGMDVVFVWCVPGRRLLTFDASVGSRVPAYVSSVGHILLGGLDDQALKSYLQALVLDRYTEHTVATKAELRREIRTAGSRGWAYVRRQHENNFFGVAVPIAESSGRVVAALHVGGVFDSRADRRAMDEILPRVRVAALRISGTG